ncbi:hypothetical protein G6F50_015503 [Rhizopus delemar]|uniref:Uncharacterized protein n=1 Tax=Rhizopus delemar TaxID=936053 RepID=A0A9P6XY11_9FUNG|nr:hypothetical protein G6F50_015503 [Rhizopus delemar]
MALGLATTTWAPRTLERYLELSAAVSLIQRLTSTPNDGEPARPDRAQPARGTGGHVACRGVRAPAGAGASSGTRVKRRSDAVAGKCRQQQSAAANLRAPPHQWRSVAGVGVPGQRRRAAVRHIRRL